MGPNPNALRGEYQTSPYDPVIIAGEGGSLAVGTLVITGAYVGNGLQAGQVFRLGGRVQYVKITPTRDIATPGFQNYSEKYDVWQDPKNPDDQYWIEYKADSKTGIVKCYVHLTFVDEGIRFNETNGFGVLGFGAPLNAKGTYYTYFAVLEYQGMPKKTNYHIPEVAK